MNNYKVTFGETTFEFSIKIQFEDKEIFDVLINGVKSIYYVKFNIKSDSYSVWSAKTDKFGRIDHRQLTLFDFNSNGFPTRFPIDIVCDIIKTIDEQTSNPNLAIS